MARAAYQYFGPAVSYANNYETGAMVVVTIFRSKLASHSLPEVILNQTEGN